MRSVLRGSAFRGIEGTRSLGQWSGKMTAQTAHPIRRFLQSALAFWRGPTAWSTWILTGILVATVLAQLVVQYLLNFWNRDFFDALSRKDGAMLWTQAVYFLPLAAASLALAIFSVWGRMTFQRRWRKWLTNHVVGLWLSENRYRKLKFIAGNHQNPEHRIAEDGRLATDAPVDLVVGLLSSTLTALTFIAVLWHVGGDLVIDAWGPPFRLPGYLVIAVVVYSVFVTIAMMTIGHRLVEIIEGKNQAEAELRTLGTHLREQGEQVGQYDNSEDRAGFAAAFKHVILRWRELCWQLMGTTLISNANPLIAPVIAWILCAPKYLSGDMSLGELTQAAAAFVAVQSAFNWFVDNYQRLADWASSASRVGSLLIALDQVDAAGPTLGAAPDSWP